MHEKKNKSKAKKCQNHENKGFFSKSNFSNKNQWYFLKVVSNNNDNFLKRPETKIDKKKIEKSFLSFLKIIFASLPSLTLSILLPFLDLHHLFFFFIAFFLNSFWDVLEIPCVCWSVISFCISLLCKSIWNNNSLWEYSSLPLYIFIVLHLFALFSVCTHLFLFVFLSSLLFIAVFSFLVRIFIWAQPIDRKLKTM